MQDGAPGGEEAARWLREHFEGDPEPKISITWRDEPPDPVAYRRVLEILFAPRPDSPAA